MEESTRREEAKIRPYVCATCIQITNHVTDVENAYICSQQHVRIASVRSVAMRRLWQSAKKILARSTQALPSQEENRAVHKLSYMTLVHVRITDAPY